MKISSFADAYKVNTREGSRMSFSYMEKKDGKAVQKKEQPNYTGIPGKMKEHMESFSGISFDDVKVHYNSDKPAQLQALAYTQGNQVYIGPGQEKHLGHELGHIVQQKQNRVKPTSYIKGQPLNDDSSLEREADRIGRTMF